MRGAWLLSLGVHAVLVLAFVASGARMRLDLRTPTPQPDAIEIEIAPPAPPAPASAPPSAQPPAQASVPALQPARASVPRRAPARSVTPAAPAAPSPPGASAAPSAPGRPAAPAEPGALAMRSSAGAPDPGERRPSAPGDLSPAHAARLVAPDPGPPPSSPLDLPGPPPEQPDLRDGWKPTGGGTYEVGNPGFTARIARDGRVTIEDRPSFEFTPRMPRVETDTSNEFTGQGEPQTMLTMDIATFDMTDWVMRMAGMDPYASAKLRLLDHTREVRGEMRARARIEDLRDAIALLPRLLDQVWYDPGLSAVERRELLFRIWDECVELEPEVPGEDDELARAGRTARATVLGFIRRTLPAGSPDAYPEAELEALNARRKSAERFAPYP